jgi:acetyl esterase/lipase
MLKNLTAKDLLECASSMIAIAHGLGERVIYSGLSVGGTMAAWVAQYRPDVEQAVLIAPAFTISRGLGISISRFVMRLFLIMPNVMTQRIRPFKEGPPHNYHGFSTRGLGEMMRLGFSVFDTAKTRKPAAQSVLVITNASDPAVDNNITRQLVKRWQASGMEHIETYEFDANYQLIHDVIDPQQPGQQTELVYPILLDLMIHSQAVMANSTASSRSI